MSFFKAEHISAGYGKNKILNDVSFSLNAGEILGILGANGCGKTTLLKSLCGILDHSGTCSLCGQKMEGLSPRALAKMCSYIPQRSGISIDISALDVVLMGFNPQLGLLAHPDEAMRHKALEALDLVGLGGRENDNYLSLSEGQKQLCILARTFVSDAKLLLLDEPESALDFHHRHRMLSLLRKWTARGDRGAVVTLHDGTLALNACDVLLLLSDGRVLGTVRPKEAPTEHIEEMLRRLYGNISLQTCRSKNGQEHLMMLYEETI
ncbi:MAG: ABC transporter ATP-binding protein [Clostridia bacterium]|nr:ABC transporter ATP-binding protein [Clostridia bacterium]